MVTVLRAQGLRVVIFTNVPFQPPVKFAGPTSKPLIRRRG
jgi:hypothetical protein